MELREKAFELFKESNGNMSSKKIAAALGIDLNKVKYWRRKDNWKDNINRSRGAPKGNKNAIGNNGGAPKGNLNNFKHGMYIDDSKFSSKNFLAKYIPTATKNIIGEIENAGLSSLDILWMNITTQLAAIIRSQKIMHVKSKNDLTKVLKKETWGKNPSEEYELQFAWDKQANFLQAQSKAMKTLEGLINSYEKLLHTNWDLATEEQKMKIEVLKSRIIKDDAKNNANSIAKLDSILGQIKERNKNE
ncbi:TPA: hypothetical protein I9Z81_001262 [Clostridium perfringens]|nr:hypothetical protein [Clostridium perfringens]